MALETEIPKRTHKVLHIKYVHIGWGQELRKCLSNAYALILSEGCNGKVSRNELFCART
jgi:hypothetical protein